MKHFLITVDTEGDNQWSVWNGERVTTENAKYIPRFQNLCEEFDFRPVYLLTWEMAMDPYLATYLKRKATRGLCEIGMHLHAWNSPPYYELKRMHKANSYVTEYPTEIMYEKMSQLTQCIEQQLEVHPVSHRAGRWASNQKMFDILEQLGYCIDCSVVSGWNAGMLSGQSVDVGFDYSNTTKEAYWVGKQLLEVPMVLWKRHAFHGNTLFQRTKNLIKGRNIWLRPAFSDLKEMEWSLSQGTNDYSMFMLHSNELMPNGSPYFSSESEVDQAYIHMKQLFHQASKEFEGTLLKEYYYRH